MKIINNKKLIILTVSLCAILLLSGPAAKAQAKISVQDLLDQIAQLKVQIAILSQQLFGLQTTGQTYCYTFNNNLKYGDNNKEVVELKTVLSKEGLYTNQTSESSTVFNEYIASAVVQFQEKYASEILIPRGLAHGTGFVGILTRAKLNQLYGCNSLENHQPIINGVSGPISLTVGQTGTWIIKAIDPDNTALSYSVSWGDTALINTNQLPQSSDQILVQTTTFTHAYSTKGNYTITFYVKNNAGNTATSTINVVVVQNNVVQVPVITSLSPSSGHIGTTVTIIGNHFTANGNGIHFGEGIVNVVNSSNNSTMLTFQVPSKINTCGLVQFECLLPDTLVTPGTYNVYVSNVNGSSNLATFTVTASNHQPIINGVSGPVRITVGQVGIWTIKASDPDNNSLEYSINWGDEAKLNSGRALSTDNEDAFVQTTTFTHAYSTVGNYNITISVKDTTGNVATSTIDVHVVNYVF